MSSSSQIEINYRKIRKIDLDTLAKQYEPSEDDIANQYNQFDISDIQSFNPIYSDFFVLNETNYNRVGLNHRYYLEGSQVKFGNYREYRSDQQRYFANMQEFTDAYSTIDTYHVKYSPLLDPIHYLIGKYKSQTNLTVLPKLGNQSECFAKIFNKHNAAYVDGFFSYLTSQMKHNHNMLNAIDFYGSFLGIQKVFKTDIADHLDYVHQSKYFMENLGKGFNVCCNGSREHFDDFTGMGSRANKKRLVLEEEMNSNELGIETLEPPVDYEVIDAANSLNISCEYEKSEHSDSGSSDSGSSDSGSSDSGSSDSGSSDSGSSDNDSFESEESFDAEAFAYIPNFPVNLIFLEKCDGTLDQLFIDQEIDEDVGASCMMQIIMSLLAFQKAFHFTHNDLHTNNIMYVNTDVEFLYYKYDNRFYRVPTYGKIFKIIDFGRAIYRFKDKIYCSDSFAPKGDAYSQYNTEPYFNENRPRIEPNMSFDLCRLGTSIYDFIIQNEDEPRDEFQETIYRWCMDDNGKNVMYRRDGEERYPGFKLYKMIARNVHAHTPQEQLKYGLFSQFLMEPVDAAKLDESEVRQHGLNLDLIEREYV